MSPVYSPETDPQLLHAHAVTDAGERQVWLSRLAVLPEPIAIHCPVLGLCGFSSSLTWNPQTDQLELVGQAEPGVQLPDCSPPMGQCVRALVVALHEGVKLQFELDAQAIAPAPGSAQGLWRLQARLPQIIYRLQRRDAFRVTPSALAPAQLWLATPGQAGRERTVQVVDVSATGIAFRWPERTDAPPQQGSRLARCRLELAGTVPIDCTLVVTETRAGEDAADPRLRVGCRFEGLSPSEARAVQIYVNLAQVRARAKRPQLGLRATSTA
jgi:c-di-GMP-binding flagellar brake protein YcgR